MDLRGQEQRGEATANPEHNYLDYLWWGQVYKK
jgi:hypothetical protein